MSGASIIIGYNHMELSDKHRALKSNFSDSLNWINLKMICFYLLYCISVSAN